MKKDPIRWPNPYAKNLRRGRSPGDLADPRKAAELALVHVNNDRTEAAYRNTGLFARGRTLIEQWDDYLAAA